MEVKDFISLKTSEERFNYLLDICKNESQVIEIISCQIGIHIIFNHIEEQKNMFLDPVFKI